MEKPEIAFLYINSINGVITGANYQIDCGYVRAYLKRKGISSAQYIRKNVNSIIEIVDGIKELDVKYVVVYINEYNYYVSSVAISALKNSIKDINIIVFGTAFCKEMDIVSLDVDADYIVVNQAWRTIYELLYEKKNRKTVANIFVREEERFIYTYDDIIAYTLDNVGFPYSEGCIPVSEVQNVGIISSIGCIGQCLFCSYGIGKERFAVHSIEGVIRELTYISKFWIGKGIKIAFLDDCFSMNEERTLKLCDAIIKNKLNYEYWCCTRADLINPCVIDKLYEAGFKGITIGLETASVKALSELGKLRRGQTALEYIKKVSEAYHYAEELGLDLCVSINHGLPGSEYNDEIATFDYLEKEKITKVSHCYTTIFPKSKILYCDKRNQVDVRFSPTKYPMRTYYNNFDIDKLPCYSMEDENLYSVLFKKSAICGEACGVTYGHSRYIFMNNIGKEELEFLNRFLFINGAVVRFVDHLTLMDKSLYCDNRKSLKYTVKEYDEVLENAFRMAVFVPNQYFIFRKSNNSKVSILKNNVKYRNSQDICIRELGSIQMVQQLLDEALKYDSTHKISILDIKKGIIKNSCMFKNSCGAKELGRVECKNGKVYACNDVMIGDYFDKYDDFMLEINKKFVDLEEKCYTCDYYVHCAKCICLPPWFSRKNYCSFMKNNKVLYNYVNLINSIGRCFSISVFCGQYCNDDLIDIIVDINKLKIELKIKNDTYNVVLDSMYIK